MQKCRWMFLSVVAAAVAMVATSQSAVQADDDLAGSWRLTSSTIGGQEQSQGLGMTVVYENGKVRDANEPEGGGWPYEVDKTASPCAFNVLVQGQANMQMRGIYRIEGDTLTTCVAMMPGQGQRPSRFRSTASNGMMVQTFTRVTE